MLCDGCDRHLATQQITLDDESVWFVCGGCFPEGNVIHRVVFSHDLDQELESMLA